MAQEIVRIAQASPELLVFLALAAGYFIGKIKIKGFGLGTTASVLIAAMALGLNVFIACIGLASGKQAVAVLQASAINVFAAGVVVALAPIVVGVLFGKFLLRMNPVLLLGALTGARVTSAALTTLQDEAESSTLTLGFAAPYAFANVILTIMGSVIVNVM